MRLKILMALLLSVVLCGTAYAATGSSSTRSSADTRIVLRDGRKIAFHVILGKPPAIVLDAGGGNDSTYWEKFAPQLANETGARIITYDRAGFGQSDEKPGPWMLVNGVPVVDGGRHTGAEPGLVLRGQGWTAQ